MIKLLEDAVCQDFSNFTLVIPAVSVGNVGQLSCDLLIANLKSCKKSGLLYHPAIESVVGNNVAEDGKVSLMTSCEIFVDESKKLCILQLHAPVLSKKAQEFVDYLTNWIQEQKFQQVICLSSTFASERIDSQLSGPPFRFLTSTSTPQADQPSAKGWKSLEGRAFPAPAVVNGEVSRSESGETYLPGSGITKELLDKCEERKIPLVVLLMFVSEGDNTQDAKYFLSETNQLYGWLPPNASSHDNIRVPASWVHLFGTPFPQQIY